MVQLLQSFCKQSIGDQSPGTTRMAVLGNTWRFGYLAGGADFALTGYVPPTLGQASCYRMVEFVLPRASGWRSYRKRTCNPMKTNPTTSIAAARKTAVRDPLAWGAGLGGRRIGKDIKLGRGPSM